MKKFARFLLAGVLVFTIFAVVTPAMAQVRTDAAMVLTPTPVPDETRSADGEEGSGIDWQAVGDWAKLVVGFAVMVVLLGYGSGVSSELIKDFLRWFTANRLLKFAFPDGSKAGLLAFLVALAAANGFDTTLFKDIPLVADVMAKNPELITMLTTIITFALSSFFKKQQLLDYVYKATPTASYKLETIKPLFVMKPPAPPAAK